jgi:hypothetical protein
MTNEEVLAEVQRELTLWSDEIEEVVFLTSGGEFNGEVEFYFNPDVPEDVRTAIAEVGINIIQDVWRRA